MKRRHNADSSRATLNDLAQSGSRVKKVDILFDIIVRAGRPVTALWLHNVTGWPYNTVTARLGDLRDQRRTIDSDEDSAYCPTSIETHSCCDGTGRPSQRKTYAAVPVELQQSLFARTA